MKLIKLENLPKLSDESLEAFQQSFFYGLQMKLEQHLNDIRDYIQYSASYNEITLPIEGVFCIEHKVPYKFDELRFSALLEYEIYFITIGIAINVDLTESIPQHRVTYSLGVRSRAGLHAEEFIFQDFVEDYLKKNIEFNNLGGSKYPVCLSSLFIESIVFNFFSIIEGIPWLKKRLTDGGLLCE